MRSNIEWKRVLGVLSICVIFSGCAVDGESESLISVSPKSAVVKFGDSQQFSVSPAGTSVTWSVNGIDGGSASTVGSIDTDGLYAAPLGPIDTTERVTIRARDVAGSSGTAKVFLTNFKTNTRLTQYALNAFRSNTYSSGQKGIAVYKDSSNNINVYAVWADNSQGVSRIWLAKSADGGTTFDAPLAVDEGTSPSQISPSVAVDSSGNVFIVWEDYRDVGDANIFVKRYDSTGFGTRKKVNLDFFGNVDYDTTPSIAIDSLNTIHVVWEHRDDSTDNYPQIYYARSSDLGQTFSTPVSVASTNGRRPAIAVDALNTAYVVWEDLTGFPLISRTRIMINRITGVTPGTPVTLDFPASSFHPFDHARYPSVASGPGGKIYVVWQRAFISDPGFTREIITTYDLDLARVDGATLLSDIISSFPHDPNVGFFGGSAYPSIAADNSRIYIAWGDQRNGTKDIYFSKSSDGVTFTTDRIVNDEASSWHEKPSAAVADGKAYVIWGDYRNTSTVTTISPNDVFFSREE